jgi:dolichyl-diphosphooligosaccharide--protein glycosyltransferase
VALFAFAFAVRALPWRTTFGEERTYLFGNDAYYHLRRILVATVHLPKVIDHDPYVAFPAGAAPHWSPFFDGLIALAVRPFVQPGDAARVEALVVWIPPILGAATVLAVYRLALRWFDPGVALAAGLLLAILSAHFWYSQLGFVDHHVAISLLSTCLLGAAMQLVGSSGAPAAPLRPLLRAACAVGALQAGILLIWTGSLIHVGIVQSALLVAVLARPGNSDARRFAVALFAMDVVALFGVSAGLGGELPGDDRAFRLVRLSAFHPALFAVAALLHGGLALLWRLAPLGRNATRRRISATALIALAVTACAAVPVVRDELLRAWRVFTAGVPFIQSVGESAPLLAGEGGALSFTAAEIRFGHLCYLVPVVLPALLTWSRTRQQRAAHLLLAWWFAVLCGATLMQLRFMNSFAPAFSLLLAWAGITGARALWRRAPASRPVRAAVGASFALLGALALAPMTPSYRSHLANQLAALARGPVLLTPYGLMRLQLIDLGGWLRQNTPRTSGYFDTSQRPEYGVLSAWTIGHVLRYEARRPVVRDNFGTNLKVGQRYFRSDETKASALLEALETRYVVVQAELLSEVDRAGSLSMLRRLYFHGGSEVRGPPGGAPIPALERHRLIYESGPSFDPPGETARFKVFEFVRGARVSGRAAPGIIVRATLPLRTNREREFFYRATTVADAKGRYRFRLPYATHGAPPAVTARAPYTIHCLATRLAQLGIDEADVQAGGEVRGPDLCL